MSPPPTQTQTHENMDIPLSLRHQSSDMSDHVKLYVMGTQPVLFTLLVLFSPAHLYCKSLPGPQKAQ